MTNFITSVFLIAVKLLSIFLLDSFEVGVLISITISTFLGIALISTKPLVSMETLNELSTRVSNKRIIFFCAKGSPPVTVTKFVLKDFTLEIISLIFLHFHYLVCSLQYHCCIQIMI